MKSDFTSFILKHPILYIFASLLVSGFTPGIKRESGENPELSRSCKLQTSKYHQKATVNYGKAVPRGVSQKTCL